MSKPKRLSGLGNINYRNIGLGFSIGILMEMRKELDDNCKQIRLIGSAEKALAEVLKSLPDEMTEEQVKESAQIFLKMEQHIIRTREYSKFLSDEEQEELNDMLSQDDHDWYQLELFPTP